MISGELKELLIESKNYIHSSIYSLLVDDALKQNDINYVSSSKDTLLIMNIIHSNNLELIEMLLKNGADVNHQSRWGITALMITAQSNMVEKAKILLKYNPDLNLEDNVRRTSLEMAQIFNSHEVEELILEKMKNNNQETSLSNEENVITEEDYRQKLIRRFNNINAKINK